ncbi:MAG TPA: porin [Gammaproteobacteria bacterium]|nr:porin [Gammaproteobacteria bacterium]
MHSSNLLKTSIASALLLASTTAYTSETDSLQQQLDALKAENKVIMERLEATADMLESGNISSPAPGNMSGADNHASATTTRDRTFGTHGSKGKTTIGGYGEMHYTNTDSTNEIDLHRFILFMGHEFTDKIRFWSELEVEHAKVDANGGEVSMEQAYLEFDINDNNSIRTGVILVPVGIINETHEPPTFYGVERNNVEKYIIPTTWREGGASLTGRFADTFSYDLAIHSGLLVSSGDYAIRGGRNSVREAPMQDPAYTARLKWTGVAGVELGAAIQYQRDVTQSTDTAAGSATLLETHAIWQTGAFAIRALYASWDLSGNGPKNAGADEQSGWYIEPAYKINSQWGVYARQSSWDNQVNSSNDTQRDQTDFGFSYWPHEDVVVKANYQLLDKAGTDDDGFMLGVGYQF